MKCKHSQLKEKCEKCFEEKFGSVCNICGKRKQIFTTSSGAEGGRDSVCKCNEKVQ